MIVRLLKERWRALLLAVIVFTCTFGLVSNAINWHQECIARNTSSPIVPIYPNSTITDFTDYGARNERWGGYYFLLETEDSVDDVIAFYSPVAGCSEDRCMGPSDPFGVYYVVILETQDLTRFRLEVEWDKCYNTKGWEKYTSVEPWN